MRLIDADALREIMYHKAFEEDSHLIRWDSGCWIRYKMFGQALEEAPTIDAEPARRGKWLINKEDGWITIAPCSVCGGVQDVDFPYCPNCGAKMEEQG